MLSMRLCTDDRTLAGASSVRRTVAVNQTRLKMADRTNSAARNAALVDIPSPPSEGGKPTYRKNVSGRQHIPPVMTASGPSTRWSRPENHAVATPPTVNAARYIPRSLDASAAWAGGSDSYTSPICM